DPRGDALRLRREALPWAGMCMAFQAEGDATGVVAPSRVRTPDLAAEMIWRLTWSAPGQAEYLLRNNPTGVGGG
ncbi:MAG: hypothetical protein NXI32_29075, partial [bacterium]|nr:hypothetical protein [bacterium]